METRYNKSNIIKKHEDSEELNLINNISKKTVEIINGVKIEIPDFTLELNDFNLKCQYDIDNISNLSTIINKKCLHEIIKINKEIIDKKLTEPYTEIDKDIFKSLSYFKEKFDDYYQTKSKYKNQVIKIIITRRKTFLDLNKINWIIKYKIKKRKELFSVYEEQILNLQSNNIYKNKNINNYNYENVQWIYLSYPEYRNLYKPSILATCRKMKQNFQYMHNIKLRVIQDRNQLKFELNELLKLIQSKKKELNYLFDKLKKLENQKKKLFQKLVSLRVTRIKEIITKLTINTKINKHLNFQNEIEKSLIEDLKNKTIDYESIYILKYDIPIIINHVKEIKKFINTEHIENVKKKIMKTKKEMNDIYLKNFNKRLNNNFHILPHLINKIRSTYPLIYKNEEGFQFFKHKILNNQIKTLYKIQNDNQDRIIQLQFDLKNNKLDIEQSLHNILLEDQDFNYTYQYYQKIIEKKEQQLLKAFRNYKKLI